MRLDRSKGGWSAVALAMGLLGAGGCASTGERAVDAAPPGAAPPVSGPMVWVAGARPAFATIQRDTSYVIVSDAYRDAVVLEDQTDGGRVTWLLSLPASAPAGATFGVGEAGDPMSAGAWGWVIEEPSEGSGHAAPLRGSVGVDGREGDVLTLSLDVAAEAGPAQRGSRRAPLVALRGVAGVTRFTPEAVDAAPMDRRGGVRTPEPEAVEPIWATLWNFPEPPPPRNRFGQRQR